jgi:hypothetical protein
MHFLKNILRIRFANHLISQSFSSKKSSEQLAYYQHRLETLPHFSNQPPIQATSPSVRPSPSTNSSTSTPNSSTTPRPLPKLKQYAGASRQCESTARRPSSTSDRSIIDCRSPSSQLQNKCPTAGETSSARPALLFSPKRENSRFCSIKSLIFGSSVRVSGCFQNTIPWRISR